MLQTGELRVDSRQGQATTHTRALGFGESDDAAEAASRASLRDGFADRAAAYSKEWHQ